MGPKRAHSIYGISSAKRELGDKISFLDALQTRFAPLCAIHSACVVEMIIALRSRRPCPVRAHARLASPQRIHKIFGFIIGII